jgi:hypothetical protein
MCGSLSVAALTKLIYVVQLNGGRYNAKEDQEAKGVNIERRFPRPS